jgi:HD-like signal output (HDOD) protein
MNDSTVLNKPAAAPTAPSALSQKIALDLDQQRKNGALRQITIPPCPALLTRLQAALALAEPDMQEVARIAHSDVAMAATLLRNANSALYTADQPVQTVGQAMNRIGLDQAAVLLTDVLVRQAIPVNHPRLKGFWQQASLRAAAMNFIARQLPGVPPELAQLYGLFNHVGIPVLLQRLPGYSGTLVEAHARRDRSFVATENANHRTDHAVVGALVARVWGVAPAVMSAIRLHHEFAQLDRQDADPEVHTLVAMGLLAEDAMRRRENLEAEHDWKLHAGAALDWLGLTEGEVADWDERLQPLLDAV